MNVVRNVSLAVCGYAFYLKRGAQAIGRSTKSVARSTKASVLGAKSEAVWGYRKAHYQHCVVEHGRTNPDPTMAFKQES